jgi:uncharacterized protein
MKRNRQDRGRQNLVILARQPQLGAGKRRLAADIGNIGALWFQRRAIAVLKRRCGKDVRWHSWMATSPDRPSGWTAPCRPVAQGGGDLGERLARVIRTMPRGPVVVIGSDAPQVRAHDIAAAFAAMRRADVVLGPSVDGGFWLVGIRRPDKISPFGNVRWSSAFTLADVLGNLQGARVTLLETLEDVDDGASLQRLHSLRRR